METLEKFITVDGLRIHTLCAGDSGSPVLLLHGGGADSARLSWEKVITSLAESGHQVYAPDLPGYGESDRPDIAYNTGFYTTLVGNLMSAFDLKQASLMGLSMGGAISLGVTLKWPERVRHLVLVDSYGVQRKVALHFMSWLMVQVPGIMESTWLLSRSSRSMSRWLLSSIFYNPKTIPNSLMDELFAEARKPYAGRAFTRYQRNDITWNGLRTIFLEHLAEIKSPTLVIHGRNDTAVPLTCAEEAHRLIANSQLHIIDHAGHWPQREKPEEFIQIVTDFLKDKS